MTRHERTPLEIAERTRLIGEVVLETELPSATMLDAAVLESWGAAAAMDPYREGALRFDFDGYEILFRYRAASDRLSISTADAARPPRGTLTDPGAGLGRPEAEQRAKRCLAQLEQGVVGQGEFVSEPDYASVGPTYVESSQSAWIGRYNFVYNPSLDGLPLTSAEVIISVNASSGRCQRITVSGQVALQRIGDAPVDVRDEAVAKKLMIDKIGAATSVHLQNVHIDGHFGYYLPLTASTGKIVPSFIAGYSTETGTPDSPLLSRRKMVALPLVDSDQATLVELLGPNW